jgi:hypothetical protein
MKLPAAAVHRSRSMTTPQWKPPGRIHSPQW